MNKVSFKHSILLGLLVGAITYAVVAFRWPVFADHGLEIVIFMAPFLIVTPLLAGVGRLMRIRAPMALASSLVLALSLGSLAVLLNPDLGWWLALAAALVGGGLGWWLSRWVLRTRTTRLLAASLVLILAGWLVPAPRASESRDDHPSVVIVGVDAATWTILDRLLDTDELPTLGRLIESGASGVLLSEAPSLSPRVWTTIATGKEPQEHGIEGFFSTQADLKAARVWDILRYHGYSTGLFQWLVTWPPAPLDPFVVPGWMARGPETHPETLQFVKELELAFQTETYATTSVRRFLGWGVGYLNHGLRLRTCLTIARRAVRDLVLDDRWQTSYAAKRHIQLYLNGDLLLDLVRRQRPQFLASVFYGTDNLAHKFWKYAYPEDFGIRPEEAAPFATLLTDYYRSVDRITGELLRLLPEDTTVFVVSDHGFASTRPGIGKAATTSRVAKARMTAVCRMLGLQVPDQVSVASVAEQGYVMFHGDPEEARELLEQTSAALDAVRLVGDDRHPLFQIEEVGPLQLQILVDLPPDTDSRARVTVPAGEIELGKLVQIEERGGSHSLEGILIASGPGIRRGTKIEEAHLRDVTPTLLYLLRLPVGADMAGQVLQGIVEPDFRSAHPIELIPSYDELDLYEAVPETDADQKALEEQLKALGYLN